MNKKIYFFYPSLITGGAEFLLKRTAELLSKEYVTNVVDIRGGWLSENIKCSEILYIEGLDKIKLPSDSVLIIPSSLLRNLDRYFESSEAKVVSWTIQPQNIIPYFPLFKKVQNEKSSILNSVLDLLLRNEKQLFKKILTVANDKKSLYAMDSESDMVFEERYSLTYSHFLPVAIHDELFVKSDSFESKDQFKVAWLGRLDNEFKFYILKKLIKDLSTVASEIVEFIVIGDGPSKKQLIDYSKNFPSLNINFIGELKNEELYEIISSCSIGFAMGTSAIEFSAKGVPTILLDYSYKEVSDSYRYRWFYEAEGFTLGRNIERLEKDGFQNSLFIREIVDEVKRSYFMVANECYRHAFKNHSMSSLKIKLINAISEAELTLNDLYILKISKKPFWDYFRKFFVKKGFR